MLRPGSNCVIEEGGRLLALERLAADHGDRLRHLDQGLGAALGSDDDRLLALVAGIGRSGGRLRGASGRGLRGALPGRGLGVRRRSRSERGHGHRSGEPGAPRHHPAEHPIPPFAAARFAVRPGPRRRRRRIPLERFAAAPAKTIPCGAIISDQDISVPIGKMSIAAPACRVRRPACRRRPRPRRRRGCGRRDRPLPGCDRGRGRWGRPDRRCRNAGRR